MNWHALGFLVPPRQVTLGADQRVYRVWGGQSTKFGSPTQPVVFLSSMKPASRREAERRFAVWEWGNSCLWVTTFDLLQGTVIFVGPVDPGVHPLPSFESTWEQIVVPQPVAGKMREVGTQRLHDDLRGAWVANRAGHA